MGDDSSNDLNRENSYKKKEYSIIGDDYDFLKLNNVSKVIV